MTKRANIPAPFDRLALQSNLAYLKPRLPGVPPLHQIANEKIQRLWRDGNELWISRQVLREFIATVTRPQVFGNPQPISTVVDRVRFFQTQFKVAEDNAQVTANLLALVNQVSVGGKQLHDANIVATMQTYGITHLLTHNIADFNRFARFITVLPLVQA